MMGKKLPPARIIIRDPLMYAGKDGYFTRVYLELDSLVVSNDFDKKTIKQDAADAAKTLKKEAIKLIKEAPVFTEKEFEKIHKAYLKELSK